MDYGKVLGATTGLGGAATIASLPNTGGSKSVVAYVAMASIAFGAAVLISTAARLVAKRHFSA